MTAGLSGSGSEAAPWLITTRAEMVKVLRDASSSGYYRLSVDIDAESETEIALDYVLTAVASSYAPKVIDLDGYTVRFRMKRDTSSGGFFFGCIHFKRGAIFGYYECSTTSSTIAYWFYRCSLEDCAAYLDTTLRNGTSVVLISSPAATPFIEPRVLKRVVFLSATSPLTPLVGVALFPAFNPTDGLTVTDAYVAAAEGFNGVIAVDMPTLAKLDGYDKNFTAAGWEQVGAYIYPYQTESIQISITTLNAGAVASRWVWMEQAKNLVYLGETSADGIGAFSAKVKRKSSFALIASESLGLDELNVDKVIESGAWYLSRNNDDFVYQALEGGKLSSLSGVVFSDQPVEVGGITFIPRACYPSTIAPRSSALSGGLIQTIVLDNASGGSGPVITGDPAFLEGTIEEIHPMTGGRQAIANCEVVAFERRGSDYIAMGSAYSDGIGSFRLETEVYGGGDVFAFAADFPGVIFQPGVALNAGDRIRPALANGYVYEIVQPGTAGGAEPVWWPDAGGGTEGNIGTAVAQARPYYQPVGHGPLKMTLIE